MLEGGADLPDRRLGLALNTFGSPSHKLSPKYLGQYKIMRQVNPVTFEVNCHHTCGFILSFMYLSSEQQWWACWIEEKWNPLSLG